VGGSIANTPVGLSYILQEPFSGSATRLLSFNLSHGIGHFGSIAFFALRDFGTGSTTLSLSLSVALDGRTSVAVSSTRSSVGDDRGSNQVQFQRTLPEDAGVGLQLSGAQGQSKQLTGQVFGRTAWADLNAGASRGNGQTDVRAGASGALAWMDGSIFATRRIDGSFAVVEVGDYPDVAVTRDHHEVARTDSNGRALVSGLRGFEVNRVGAEPADLPLDASVDALDVEFVPPAHTGIVLRMPIKRSRSATFRVVGEDGAPLPAGTQLLLAGRDATYPVGFDGRSFIAGLEGRTVVRAHGAAGDCHFLIVVPAGDADDLPDLGTQRCL
jgi:outer membrane usher protein